MFNECSYCYPGQTLFPKQFTHPAPFFPTLPCPQLPTSLNAAHPSRLAKSKCLVFQKVSLTGIRQLQLTELYQT